MRWASAVDVSYFGLHLLIGRAGDEERVGRSGVVVERANIDMYCPSTSTQFCPPRSAGKAYSKRKGFKKELDKISPGNLILTFPTQKKEKEDLP